MPCFQVLRHLCPGDKGAQAKPSRGPGRDGSWRGSRELNRHRRPRSTSGPSQEEVAVRSGQEWNQYHTPAMFREGALERQTIWPRAEPLPALQPRTWERYPASGCVDGTEGLPGGQTERISIPTLCFPCSEQESIPGSRNRGAASLQAARPVPGFGSPAQRPLCPTAGPEACPPPSPPGTTPPAGHPRAEACMLPAPSRRAQPQPCGSPLPTRSVRGLSTRPPSSTSAGQELDTCSGQFTSRYPGL